MRMTFEYDAGNGRERVEVGPMAIIGYEVANKTKVSKLASDGFGIVDMSELVWRQLKIDGRTTVELDAFRGSLVDLDPVVSADPT